MAMEVQWQSPPFDIVRLIIGALSRVSVTAPETVNDVGSNDEQQVLPTSSYSPSTPSSPNLDTSLISSLNVRAVNRVLSDDALINRHFNSSLLIDEDDGIHQELFRFAIRTLRLVSRGWCAAASSAVVRLQLCNLDMLRVQRPLDTIVPELNDLDLSLYTALKDDGVKLLAGCSKLVALKINGQFLTSAGIAALSPLTSLKRLDLTCGRIPHLLAHILHALPGLNHATIRGCNFALLPLQHQAGLPPPPPPHTPAMPLTPFQKRFPMTSQARAATDGMNQPLEVSGDIVRLSYKPVAQPVPQQDQPLKRLTAATVLQQTVSGRSITVPPPPPPGLPPPPPTFTINIFKRRRWRHASPSEASTIRIPPALSVTTVRSSASSSAPPPPGPPPPPLRFCNNKVGPCRRLTSPPNSALSSASGIAGTSASSPPPSPLPGAPPLPKLPIEMVCGRRRRQGSPAQAPQPPPPPGPPPPPPQISVLNRRALQAAAVDDSTAASIVAAPDLLTHSGAGDSERQRHLPPPPPPGLPPPPPRLCEPPLKRRKERLPPPANATPTVAATDIIGDAGRMGTAPPSPPLDPPPPPLVPAKTSQICSNPESGIHFVQSTCDGTHQGPAKRPPPPPPPGPPPSPPRPLLPLPYLTSRFGYLAMATSNAGSSSSDAASRPSTSVGTALLGTAGLPFTERFSHAAAEAALAPAEAAARLAAVMYGGLALEEHVSEGSSTFAPAATSTTTAPRPLLMPSSPPTAVATEANAPLPVQHSAPATLEWCASVPCLKSLHLVDVRGEWLEVTALRQLTALSVRDCRRPEQQRPLGAMADGLTALRRLALYGTSAQLDGADVAGAVSRLSGLQSLTLESLAVVPHQLVLRKDLDLLISSLAPLGPSLTHLVLRRPGWTFERLKALAPLTALTRLEVGDTGFAARTGRLGGGGGGNATGLGSDAGLQALAALFPRLRVFSLGPASSEAVTEDGVGALACRLRSLTSLDLQGCSRLRNERLGPMLKLMTGLRSLDLSNCLNLVDSTFSSLTSLSSLTNLRLRGCWKICGTGLGVLRPPLLRLRQLDLTECRITDKGLEKVACLTALTSLKLVRCWEVRAVGLLELSRLVHLAALNLASTNTDNTGVAMVVRGLGSSLTDLNLSSSLTSLEGVLALAEGMPRLRRLDLSECIPGVGLGLNDEALRHLARLSCLRRLHLRSCRSVTDAAVQELMAALPRLQHFELNGCWGVAMQTMDKLYGRPLAEWRRAEDVARTEALLSADDVNADSGPQEKY